MDAFIFLFILLYMAHDMPAISVYYPPVIYAGVTVVMTFLLGTRIRWSSFWRITPIMVFPLVNLLFKDDPFTSYMWWASLIQLFAYPIIALYLLQNSNKIIIKHIFFIYVVFQIIICVTTIIGLQIYPEACRLFGHGDFSQTTEFILFRSMNIGGFSFIYNLTLSIPLIVLVWRYGNKFNKRNTPIPLIAVLFLLLSLYTIYKSQYATAFIFSLLALGLAMIKRELKPITLLLVIVSSLLLFLVLRQPIVSALNYLSGQTSGEFLQERFESMSQSLQGQEIDDTSDLAARQLVWTKSLDVFFAHPLGAWGNAKVGGHSTWFDALARYGLLIIFFLILIIKGIKTFFLQPIKHTKMYNTVLVSLITMFMLGLFNPCYSTDFMLFVIPLYLYVVADVNLYATPIRS